MGFSKQRSRRRMYLLSLTLAAGFLVVIGALVWTQLIKADERQALAAENRTQDITVAAARGTVYDRNGEVLAVSLTADSVVAYPNQIKAQEVAQVTSTLVSILGLDFQTVYDKLTSDLGFVWIQRKVSFEAGQQIRDLKLPGISIYEEAQRYYPKGTLACQVLGFCNIDNEGMEGLEYSLEDMLRGVDGSVLGLTDSHGNPIVQGEYQYDAPENGYNVYLSLDSTIQYFCERAIAELQNSETPAARVGILVMEPNTCQILAMASSNGYDPNDYSEYDSSTWRNWLISDNYEPGSVFKVVTVSAALEEATVDSSSTFYDSGAIDVYGTNIHCWSTVPHGSQNLAEAVMNSCNPAFVQIGQTIEEKEAGLFYKYIEAFGFGAKSGVGLPGESEGLIQSDPGPVELATITIGQGIAVTPLQMVTAICAVANGGYLMQPQILSAIGNDEDKIGQVEPQVVRQVISTDTAAQVRSMMEGVVTGGSGANAAIEGYTVAGKTGTAQKAKDGSYAGGAYVASFAGIVGEGKDSLVAIVVVDEPSGIYYGSQVAAPIFASVMSDAVRYLGIAPTEDVENQSSQPDQVQVPNFVYDSAETAQAALAARGLTVELVGDGPLVVAQSPAAGAYVDSGATVALTLGGVDTTDGDSTTVIVPSLHGKRYSEAAALLSQLGLEMKAVGSGVAYQQSLTAGAQVPVGAALTVSFADEKDTVTTVAP